MATILANMALYQSSRADIAEFNGLSVLIEFLNEKPADYQTSSSSSSNSVDSEISACERVQQKSAIAISRFCRESKYALVFVKELNAVTRLVELCRCLNERNSSESVLVACLAALRQLTSCFDLLELSLELKEDIEELLKPKASASSNTAAAAAAAAARDSFLVYSSNEESYV